MDWYGDYSTTLSRDGVSVQAGIDLNRLPVPAVKYRISNDRETPVGVRIDAHLPDSISSQHVGFDPKVGGEHWRVYADGRLIWSKAMLPGEDVLTLYGVWFTDPELVYDLLEPPKIVAVEEIDEAQAQAGQPRNSTLPADLRPDWWWDDGETAAKHIIDENFSRGRTAPLRRTVKRVEGKLMGGRSPNEASPDTSDVEDAGPILAPPSDEELAELYQSAGGVPADECFHLRLATRSTEPELDDGRVLAAIADAVDVVAYRFTAGWDDGSDVLDVLVHTDFDRAELSRTIGNIEVVVDTLISEIGDVPPLSSSGDAGTAVGDSMREFTELKDEMGPTDPDELEADLAGESMAGDGTPELSINELIEEYTSDTTDGDDDATARPAGEVVEDPAESVVERLVAEVRAGNIDAEQLATLKSTLGVSPPADGEASHAEGDLASEVDRLQRITDALLDELQLVTADITKLEAKLDRIEQGVQNPDAESREDWR